MCNAARTAAAAGHPAAKKISLARVGAPTQNGIRGWGRVASDLAPLSLVLLLGGELMKGGRNDQGQRLTAFLLRGARVTLSRAGKKTLGQRDVLLQSLNTALDVHIDRRGGDQLHARFRPGHPKKAAGRGEHPRTGPAKQKGG